MGKSRFDWIMHMELVEFVDSMGTCLSAGSQDLVKQRVDEFNGIEL